MGTLRGLQVAAFYQLASRHSVELVRHHWGCPPGVHQLTPVLPTAVSCRGLRVYLLGGQSPDKGEMSEGPFSCAKFKKAPKNSVIKMNTHF